MNATRILWVIGLWLLTIPALAQQGLKGEYYTGTNFDRKVFTRTDPAISFDWSKHNPGAGIPRSYYSIRWTGKLMAPATGKYRFFAKVDDGIRLWVGNKKVIDSWRLNDSENYAGIVTLEKGKFYDLRVDYFNDMLEGNIELFWERPDVKKTFLRSFTTSDEPITAQYFFQKAPPVAVPPKPTRPVTLTPVVAASTPPKAVPQKRLPTIKPKPTPAPPPPRRTVVVDTLIASAAPVHKPVAEPQTDMKPGATIILHNVQFEQSSYVLLPESSAELDQLVAALKKNPLWHIDIVGHTDNVGDSRLNLALSEQRAKIVSTYLTRHGIADERVTTKGFGGTRPIADNTIERERSKNRRVEITIR